MKWLFLLIPIFCLSNSEFNYKNYSERRLKTTFFDSSFYNHKAYVIGDVHGMAESYEVLFKTAVHLNKTKGLTKLFLERGKDYLYFMNRFLQGDISKLELYLNIDVRNTLLETKDELKFFEKLFKYNSKRPDSLKIELLPLFEFSTPLTALNYLFRDINWKTRGHIFYGPELRTFEKLTVCERTEYEMELSFFEGNQITNDPIRWFANTQDDIDFLNKSNPHFKEEYQRFHDYVFRLDSANEYMLKRELEISNNVAKFIKSDSSSFMVFIGLDHALKRKSSHIAHLDSLFHQNVRAKLELNKDFFCFISPVILRAKVLMPDKSEYDEINHLQGWKKDKVSYWASVSYNYRMIKKKNHPKRRVMWLRGNDKAIEDAIYIAPPKDKALNVSDYFLIIKKGRPCKIKK